MKHLTYGQQIKTNQDRYRPVITIFTVRGYAKQYGEDQENAYNQAKGNGHLLACGQMHASILTDNYNGKDDDIKQKALAYENAPLIEDGEIVDIDGVKYITQYKGQYSDCVHFIENK